MSPPDQTEILGLHNQDPIGMFFYAIRAQETRRQYTSKLKAFFDFLGFEGTATLEEQSKQFVLQATKDPNWALASTMRFINFQKERIARKEITESTLRNYYKPIKLFCEMNDIQLSWRKIAKGLPHARNSGNDRAPTREEIKSLLSYPDRRIKPIVCTMISSGIRLGAWDYLRWGDIEPIIHEGKVIAAKMIVYRGEAEEYLSFISPEAYDALKEWMDYRSHSGERITKDSWVMRDLWNAENYHHGFISHPKKLKSSGIKRLIERALWAQQIRKPLEDGKKRHEFKADHGFRKYFKTRAEQVMRPINVEILMGHSTGISDSYYKPTEKEMQDDYLKAVDSLTISDENRLKGEHERLQSDIGRIKAFETEITDRDNKIDDLADSLITLSDQVARLTQEMELLKKNGQQLS